MANIDALAAGYARFYDTLIDWGRSKESVQAMFVSGSVADGSADLFSDLDLFIIAPLNDASALLDEARDSIEQGEPIVIQYRLQPLPTIQVLSLVTDRWHRINLAIGDFDSGILYQQLAPAFDPDKLWDGTYYQRELSSTSAAEITKLATEFIRVLGLSVVVNGRGDVHVGHDGAYLLRNMFIDLLLMEPRYFVTRPREQQFDTTLPAADYPHAHR